MDFHYIGGCDESGIGACVAGDQCPGVAWGFEGDGAYSHNCEGYDVGVSTPRSSFVRVSANLVIDRDHFLLNIATGPRERCQR